MSKAKAKKGVGRPKKSIASRVDLERVEFSFTYGSKKQREVVTLVRSTCELNFNGLMVDRLKMSTWTSVLVGYDPKTNIIIVRQSDPEEYGSVAVRSMSVSSKLKPRVREKYKGYRCICAAHLVRDFKLEQFGHYRAERAGKLIYLEYLHRKGAKK